MRGKFKTKYLDFNVMAYMIAITGNRLERYRDII